MAVHMSVRLAWHNEGWNGHICQKPCENVYCVGQYSYPGQLVGETRDLDFEMEHAGEACADLPCKVACGLSVNAFGKDSIKVKVDPPEWWNGEGDAVVLTLPPSTACTWCYEAMYKDEVLAGPNSTQTYDYDMRRKNAEEYFAQFEPEKSFVFYYAGYSNPFSENEENNYVIAGISRIKQLGDFAFYNNTSETIKEKYAGGFVWQKPVTSNYPDEGFCIPFWKYKDNEEILNRLVIKPQNRSPFKYGSREVTNDDAIEIVNQLLVVVDTLIEIGDTTENWKIRKSWLNSVLNELWTARGPYPGFPSVLETVGLHDYISDYLSLTNDKDMIAFQSDIRELLERKRDDVNGISLPQSDLKKIRRDYELMEDEEKKLLFDVLLRFDLTPIQMDKILVGNREEKVSIKASLDEMILNPYIIAEQYVGIDADDTIPLYKIDNGVITSPEYGVEDLLDVASTERFRAFCVDELTKISEHSFAKAQYILDAINARLDRMPEWKRHTYKIKNFDVEKDILDKALYQRNGKDNELYLYLLDVYEDERAIEKAFRNLADRPDIAIKRAITKERFIEDLRVEDSELVIKAADEYDAILEKQAEICMQIFTKPLCVLSGAAGTGKTTVIRAILDNIRRVHGDGTGFLLLAPTGKASERIKTQTGEKASTIHSFLAKNEWLNENLTLKRKGGKNCQDVNTIIIDECSMIDLNLFATLLRAINWNSVQRLILIGDPNQLPPIGRGKVFADTIEWLNNEYPENVGVLTENIRQLVNVVSGNGTGILDLADIFIQEAQQCDDQEIIDKRKANKEELFEKIQIYGNGEIDKDLSVYFWKEQSELELLLKKVIVSQMEDLTGLTDDGSDSAINKLWTETIRKEDGSSNPERIQVISPYKGEFYGTGALNTLMQKTFNSYWSKKYTLDGVAYFDKVIQFRNRPSSNPAFAYSAEKRSNVKAEIFNGEIGLSVVHSLDRYAQDGKTPKYKWQSSMDRIQVIYSGKTRQGLKYNYGKNLGKDEKGKWILEQKVQDNIELAYAISVHKSQGSEFDYVYIIIPKRDSSLLSMELIYTALTRAQKKVVILLQDDIGTLTTLSHVEKSVVNHINSSVYKFEPLPDEIIHKLNWYESGKRIATLSPYFVRSKSEAIIANILADREVPFVYEEPLYAKDGTMFLPDFTVTLRGEKYYWEHVGRLDLPDYAAHWEKKKAWYEKNFDGKLIVTYESDNLSRDAKEILDKFC